MTPENTSIKPGKLMPAIWGGLLIGVIAGVPYLAWLNCFCCMGAVAGSFLSVYLYNREAPDDQKAEMGDGALLGLLAGLIGTSVALIVESLLNVSSIDILYRIAEWSPSVKQWMYHTNIEHLSMAMTLSRFFLNLVSFTLFGLTGGILAVALFSRKDSKP